jgi:hypothetical protein
LEGWPEHFVKWILPGSKKKKRRAGTRKNQNNQTNNDDRQYGGSACDPAPGAMVVPMGGRHLAGGGVLAA